MLTPIKSFFILILGPCLVFTSAQADTLLLMHGYMGSVQQWKRAGIVKQLDAAGWHDAGDLILINGKVKENKSVSSSLRRMYNLSLQSERPLENQAQQLHHFIKYIRQLHPGEQIILIGHSAGGIVARLYMVEQSSNDLIALITIASPHLGTDKAQFMELFSDNTLAWLEPIPGFNILFRSQGLFFDLVPNRSDNLIGWLNYQDHPPAQYYSIVREPTDETFPEKLVLQDFIVPNWSQDMNEVYALRGRSKTYQQGKLHGLNKKDGEIVQQILISLYSI